MATSISENLNLVFVALVEYGFPIVGLYLEVFFLPFRFSREKGGIAFAVAYAASN